MTIHIDDRGATPTPKPLHTTIKQVALATLRHCFGSDDFKKSDYELSVSFVTDAEIAGLNKQYRDLDKPTDVLSFPAMDMQPGQVTHLLGDIVISTETAARQAEEYAHSLERELAFLAVHGVLHLMGLDHETSPQDAEIMDEIQESILAAQGLAR